MTTSTPPDGQLSEAEMIRTVGLILGACNHFDQSGKEVLGTRYYIHSATIPVTCLKQYSLMRACSSKVGCIEKIYVKLRLDWY